MSFIKSLFKSLVRTLVYSRLRSIRLTEVQALHWAAILKRWPAIFAQVPFSEIKKVDHGAQMKVGIIDVIERNLFLSGKWDTKISQVITSELRTGATMVDIGANIGYFTLLSSNLVGPKGRVIAVEPSHRNASRLMENLWLNQVANTAVISIGAGSHGNFSKLNFPTYNNAGAATFRGNNTVQDQVAAILRLDDVFEMLSVVPDLIKIDIEGYEFEALQGMANTLKKYQPVVISELTDAFLIELGQSSRQLIEFMESLGYTCEILSDSSPSESRWITSQDKHLSSQQFDVVFRPNWPRGEECVRAIVKAK